MKNFIFFSRVVVFFLLFSNYSIYAANESLPKAVAIPSGPTLDAVTIEAVCVGEKATVFLSGLLPNTYGVATFKVGNGPAQTKAGTSTASGTFSFLTSALPLGTNGAVVEITSITSNSLTTNFTGKTAVLIVNAKPTLSSVTTTPICEGNSATIVLSGLLPSTSGVATYKIGNTLYTQSGTSGADGTYSFTTGILPAAANGLTVEITKITNGGTCEATFTGKSTTLVVNPLPNAQITGTPLVCAGNSFNLTASGGVSYAWSGPVGSNNGLSAAKYSSSNASISRSINGVGQYHRIGDYTVTVTDANGCVNTATSTVGVNPVLTLNTLPLLPPVCEGSDFTITSVATISNISKTNSFPYFSIGAGNSNDISYSWTGPNGFTSSSNNAFVSEASLAAAGTYSLTITGPGGCTKTATRNVNINANPTITLDASASVCEGSDITLTASSNGNILSWFRNGNLVGLGSSLTITAADLSDAGTYTFRARKTPSLCISEQSIELVVNSLPVVTASSNSPVCDGANVALVSDGGISYSWSGPLSFSSSDQNPDFASTVDASGNYVVTATDANGCVNTANTDVVVNPLPDAQITGTPLVCAGSSFNLTASGGVSYAWSGPVGSNNGLSAAKYSSSNASISRSINGVGQYHRIGDYTVTVTDANGCVNTATSTVGVNPVLTLNTLPVVPAVCEGSDFTITSVATISNISKSNSFPYFLIGTGNSNDISYSWTGPNGFTSSSNNAFVSEASLAAAGTYSLTITGPGGCTKTATRNVNINANPTITLDASATVCEGSDITLTASSNGNILSWFRNGNLVGLGSSLTITAADLSDAGTYTFRARKTPSLCTFEQNIELVVNVAPTLSTVTTAPICAGNQATITLSGLLPSTSAVATYTVNGGAPQTQAGTSEGDGTYSFSTDALSTASNGAIVEITKIVNDVTGCTTDFSGKTVALQVNANPTLSSVTTAPVCAGDQATITLSGLLPNTSAVATYTVNGGAPQTQAGTSAGDGTYSFSTVALSTASNGNIVEITKIVNDVTGCTTDFSGMTVALQVNAIPTLSSVTTAPICSGNKATISLSGLLPNTSAVATYTVNGGAPQTQAGTSTPSGTYSFTTSVLGATSNGAIIEITKIENNGTGCTTNFTGKTVALQVNASPTLGTVTTQEIVAGSSATILLSGLLPNTTAVATYRVNGGVPQTQSGTSTAGGTFSFSTGPLSLSFNGKVVEITKITNASGCETLFTGKTVMLMVSPAMAPLADSSNNAQELIQNEGISSFSDNLQKVNFVLYPNPTSDVLNIESTIGVQIVEFVNMNGQKVLTAHDKQINIAHLPAGTYMVRVEDQKGNVVMKRVIKK